MALPSASLSLHNYEPIRNISTETNKKKHKKNKTSKRAYLTKLSELSFMF